MAYGSVPQSELIKNLVQLDERGYVVAGEDGITYAATKNGDLIEASSLGLVCGGRCPYQDTASGGNRSI